MTSWQSCLWSATLSSISSFTVMQPTHRAWLLFLSHKLGQLMAQAGKPEKAKLEFVVAAPESVKKIEEASKEGKRTVISQYAVLTEDNITVLKQFCLGQQHENSACIEAAKKGKCPALDLLIVYCTPDTLAKLIPYEKARICVLYCHPIFELNKDQLANVQGKFKTPTPEDYAKAIEEAVACYSKQQPKLSPFIYHY
eukprot:TRINITY_DN638_c0_g1_i1.p3 TRINITY_DN638_c0_g1~~TRINITY_DN638_c0_g1_i1.p3  ORF type:complete len:197 (-),score=11.79 TRINITY_DN638_c0_g1_i1:1055-1645(-)